MQKFVQYFSLMCGELTHHSILLMPLVIYGQYQRPPLLLAFRFSSQLTLSAHISLSTIHCWVGWRTEGYNLLQQWGHQM